MIKQQPSKSTGSWRRRNQDVDEHKNHIFSFFSSPFSFFRYFEILHVWSTLRQPRKSSFNYKKDNVVKRRCDNTAFESSELLIYLLLITIVFSENICKLKL